MATKRKRKRRLSRAEVAIHEAYVAHACPTHTNIGVLSPDRASTGEWCGICLMHASLNGGTNPPLYCPGCAQGVA